MRKSARILGQEFGLSAQEMNFILREEGFLDGVAGNYTVTEKGKKYAEEQDYHRGTGGYSHYNRYWTTRTWDDGIADELDITQERIRKTRQAVSSSKQKTNESVNESVYESVDEGLPIECDDYSVEDVNTTDDNNDGVGEAITFIFLAVAAYEIYQVAAPHVKRLWGDKVAPGLENLKNKVTGRSPKKD
jgi:hypothetical protein